MKQNTNYLPFVSLCFGMLSFCLIFLGPGSAVSGIKFLAPITFAVLAIMTGTKALSINIPNQSIAKLGRILGIVSLIISVTTYVYVLLIVLSF